DRGATDQLKVREGITPAPVSELLEKTLSQVAAAPAASSDPGKTGNADGGAESESSTASNEEDEDEDDDDDDSEFGPTPNYGSGASDEEAEDDAGGGATQVSLTRKSGSVWSGLVSPRLESRCGNCHGPKRQKGKFRVDSLAALMSRGKAGPGV